MSDKNDLKCHLLANAQTDKVLSSQQNQKVQSEKTLVEKLKIPDSRLKELQTLWGNNLEVLLSKQK